jgi:hypothetical protein
MSFTVGVVGACGRRSAIWVNRPLAQALGTTSAGGYALSLLGRAVLSAGLPHAAARIPGLKRLPVMKLVAVAELALVARKHVQHLDAAERRRLVELVRHGRGMSPAEREELRTLVSKLDARAFAGSAAQRLSPVRLPGRMTRARY